MKKVLYAALALVCAAAVTSCGSNGNYVTKGSASKLDTLSYYLGANIGYGVGEQMSDIPFDVKQIQKGMTEGALGKAKQTQDEAVDLLRDYFMNTVNERRAAAAQIEADTTATEPAAPVEMFESAKECNEISYAFGNDIGNNLRASKLPLQTYWVTKGFADAYNGECEVENDDIQMFMQNYFMVVRPRENAERSEKWLAKKEHSSGVKKTESGLLYKVVKSGDMSLAASDDRDVVVVHYEGKTMDGDVFDSSYERDEPADFPLNRVIKGWTEGMKLVGPGGEIILYIPSELAYGSRGAGRDIGPNEALEFKVELLEVHAYEEPQPVEEAVETAEE